MSKKIEALVLRGTEVRARIDELKAEMAEITENLIEAGGGLHPETGHKALLIEPKPMIVMPESLDDVQALAGEHFGKLFETVKSHKPVKSFEDVAKALLPKGKASKLIALCQKAKTPFLKWS